jgi:hypothetical protein
MNTEEKAEKINKLMKLKEVTVQDDYFIDIFNDKNNNEIFRVMSSRGFDKHPEKEEEVMNEILKKLNAFKIY